MSAGPLTHSDTIDLANVARTIKRGWFIIAAMTVVGVGLGAAVVKLAPPKYRGSSQVMMKVASERGSLLSQLSGLDAGGALGGGLKGSLETESKLMTSRAVVGDVVDTLRLQARIVTPRRIAPWTVVSHVNLVDAFPKATFTFTRRDSTTFDVRGATRDNHFEGRLSGSTVRLPQGEITFADARTLPATFVLEVRDRQDAITRALSQFSVDKPGGEVLAVVARTDDSLSAMRLPNTLVATYFRQRKGTDRSVNARRVDFLEAQIDTLSRQLTQAEHALKNQQDATGVLDPEVFGRLQLEEASGLRTKLTEAAIEEASLRDLIGRIQSRNAEARDLAAFPSFVKAPGVSSLFGELTALETQLYKLRADLKAADPSVLALESAKANVEAKLQPFAKTYLTSVTQQREQLAAKLDTIRGAVAKLPATAESAVRLQRDVLTLSKNYGLLQTQLVDARLAALSEGGEVTLIDSAFVPKEAAFPRPEIVVPAAAAGGLLLGVIAALVIGMLGRWMQDPSDVERSTGVPTLAFDPRAPLIVPTHTTRTVLVAPLDGNAFAAPVAARLAHTAASRAIRATVLDASHRNGTDLNRVIASLEEDHDLVIVQLPELVSDEAVAALRQNRPVLLVTPGRRVDRSRLLGAVQLLKRLDIPCAGIVMSGAPNGRPLVSPTIADSPTET